MRTSKLFVCLAMLNLLIMMPANQARGENRIGVSIVLSGHIMCGVKFEHYFNEQQNIHFTVYPFMFPGKGYPFALSTGFNQYSTFTKFQGMLGIDFTLLVSPPAPDERKTMPMITLNPGFIYNPESGHPLGGSIWISHFLKHANRFISPTGLEFKYGL